MGLTLIYLNLIVPYFLIMMAVMVLVFFIPELAVWLPNLMIQ